MHNTHNSICTPSTPSPSSSLLLCSRLVLHFISSSTLCSPSSRLIMLFVPLPPVLLSSRALNLAAVSFLRHHFVPSYHALSFSLSVRSIMSSPSLPFCCDSVTLLLCLRRGCCVPVLLISSFVTFFSSFPLVPCSLLLSPSVSFTYTPLIVSPHPSSFCCYPTYYPHRFV